MFESTDVWARAIQRCFATSVGQISVFSLVAIAACGGSDAGTLDSDAPPADGDHAGCLAGVFAAYGAAQEDWQSALHDLVVEGRPALAELAAVSRDLQLAMTAQAAARFTYLNAREPSRLRPADGLSTFVNVGIDWTDEDDARLAADNSDYENLLQHIDELRARNDDHPDWPALRSFMQEELSQGAPFQEAMADLQAASTDLEARLAACPSR